MKLLERLKNEVLTADGGMGTLLYSYGINFCYEELNVKNPTVVERIHNEYIAAGADVIQTNTYSANAIKLARYGLEHEVRDFNVAAVRLAKKAAKQKKRYVLGTIGAIRGISQHTDSLSNIAVAFQEQAEWLLSEDPDGLILETYYDFEELTTVLPLVRKLTDLPIIAQVSMQEPGVLQNGLTLDAALSRLEELGANVVGVNCRLGPYHTIEALEEVEIPKNAFLSAYPNASLMDLVDDRIVYSSEAEYFAEAAISLRNEGARLIGGCCGTTPEHIRATKKALARLRPVTEKIVKEQEPITVTEHAPGRNIPTPLHVQAKKERTLIVEWDTPKSLDTSTFIKGAKALYDSGVTALTMADNSLASPRISNLAMAALLNQKHGDIRSLIHITCRDRNLIGLQSHLMGLHAMGFHDILAITGDPSKVGDFPGATSVYDVASMELTRLIKQMNEGISFSGKHLKEKTRFSVSAAFNPNVRLLDKAVKRIEKKMESGADSIITQPVYSKEKIVELYELTKHLDIPIFIGIMPLVNSRNAEFLHNEVPGIKLSDEVRERMRACADDRETSRVEGIQIAKELIDTAAEYFNGIYLITPFSRYDMTVELVQHVHEIDRKRTGAEKILG